MVPTFAKCQNNFFDMTNKQNFVFLDLIEHYLHKKKYVYHKVWLNLNFLFGYFWQNMTYLWQGIIYVFLFIYVLHSCSSLYCYDFKLNFAKEIIAKFKNQEAIIPKIVIGLKKVQHTEKFKFYHLSW